MPRYLLLVAFLLPAGTLACPAGQTEICVVQCLCAPLDREDVEPWIDQVSPLAASSLAEWIRQSRAAIPETDLHPVPPELRAQLAAWYSPAILDRARYKVGDNGELSAAHTLMQNPDVDAVTLDDVIIFRDGQDAASNLTLWAHELKHVEQYQQWGVDGFAQRYSRDADAVEAPAYAAGRVAAGR